MPTTPPTARARRRLALDPRLLIGMGLVVASVAAVVGVVGAADARVVVYAAVSALSPGDRVDAGDLVERSVALDGAEGHYLTPADLPADGLVLIQGVGAGELIPASAAGSTAGLRSTALVVELSTPVSSAVAPGALVDVWGAAAGEQNSFGPPAVLVSDAVVMRLVADDGFVSAGSGVGVEVLVPRSRVARLLQAIANGDALAIVPAGIPLGAR